MACTSSSTSTTADAPPPVKGAASFPVVHQTLAYPETKKADVVETLHGQKIADPYRWLEDPNAKDTAAWVDAQNAVTFAYLETIPTRAVVRERLTKLWNYERYGVPSRQGDWYIFSKNDGLQNQSVIYKTKDLSAPPEVLLDPNTLSTDGTVALSGASFSKDGKYMAYSTSSSGSDWQQWQVRDVATGKDLSDRIEWSKFSGADWKKDGSGFYYSRYDKPADLKQAFKAVNKFQKVYFHKVGTPQSQDVLVYERKDQPDWGFGASVTDDGRFLLIYQSEGTNRENRIFVRDLEDPNGKIEPFLDAFDAQYSVVGNDGETFYVWTDKDAPRNRLVAIDRKQGGDPAQWKTLIAQTAAPNRDVLSSVSMVGDRFVAVWRTDAHEKLRLVSLDGRPEKEIPLPAIGALGGISGERKDKEAFYAFTSFTYPTTTYRYDFTTGTTSVFRQPKVDFDPTAFETRQVFYSSKDGTKIPMFIVHKKGIPLDGNNPTYLYGYGGFDISLEPTFSPSNVAWMEMGGVYAQPNLRGGGEYGKEWHDAGRLKNKQNVFDDFIAAAEWLIANQYTKPARLAIGGGSNGGLLVGAAMTQRPELFGAALPAVGVMDMLRFHKFTIGWAWKSDYGDPDKKEDFDVALKYSPLHNLKPGVKYPATLVTTGDHDDRVVPAHSHKFIAALQAAHAGDAPVLTRIETKAGHGAGKPTSKIIEERADQWAFLTRVLGMVESKPQGKM
jgi:prolyl oligopeptidase